MNIQITKPSYGKTIQSCFMKGNIAVVISLALLLSSCATQAPVEEVEETPEMVWPNPPDQAVIRYVGFVRDLEEADIEERPSFKDILAGKDPEKKAKTLNKPFGVHGDERGRLFVADTALGSLVVYDLNTNKVETWGETGMGKLSKPIGVTSDKNGRIYVCDIVDRRVVIYDGDGKYLDAFGGKDIFQNPVAIAINDDLNRIYVLDSQKHQLMAFDMQGDLLFTKGQKGFGPEFFMYPSGIAIGADGRLFISDSMNFRVKILDADGEYISSFGKIGQNLGDFNRPKGIALDSDGHIYVVDSSFQNFQIFNQEGQLLLFIGGAGREPGQFQLPTGIHIDRQNKIYVADQLNHRVQVFEYLGEPVPENTEPAEPVQ